MSCAKGLMIHCHPHRIPLKHSSSQPVFLELLAEQKPTYPLLVSTASESIWHAKPNGRVTDVCKQAKR